MSAADHTGLSLALCEAVAGIRYDDIPLEVIERLKLFLVDTFGVIRAASDAPGIEALNQRLEKWERQGTARILLSGQRVSPPSAALANGAAAHALDFDDQHDPARVHTNCVVLPALLAAAEDVGSIDGRRFLTAMAVGAEVHARLGLACTNSLGWGWHPTMTLGSLAAALAVGRLLNLPVAGLQNAFGMAFHQTSGSAQSMRDGVLSKRLGAGFAARAAVLGTFLAADGLTGTQRTLEGSAGLISLYERDTFEVEHLMGGLGRDWLILDYSLKPYPCCRATHSVIGLALQVRQEGIRPSDIASLEIGLGEHNWMAVGAPYDPQREEVVHAQFNACYAFARALHDGKVDFDSFSVAARSDPAIAALTAKSTCVNDARIAPPAIHPAHLRLVMQNGTERTLFTEIMKGSPADPMTREAVIDKFNACMRQGLRTSPSASLADLGAPLLAAIASLEQSNDVGQTLGNAFPQ